MSPRGLILYFAVFVVASSLAVPRPAAADDGMKWQFYESNDPDNKGAMTARLVYGVPETDNVQVMGVCDARPSTGAKFSSVTFGANIGDLPNGKEADLRFSGGGVEQTLHGNIERGEGEGLSGVHVDIKNDDAIWAVFSEKDTLDYQVPGYRTATLDLAPGRDKLKAFVDACRTYEKAVLGTDTEADETAAAEANGNAEKDAFDSAKELGTVAAFEAFLSTYPTGFYADLARAYITKLNKAETATPAPPPPEKKTSPPPEKKASSPAASKPEKKKASTPKCRSRSVLIDGKCILKRNAAGYCGPGYHLKGNKCVHGAYVAPKVRQRRSNHGCPPGQVWSAQELCHYDD